MTQSEKSQKAVIIMTGALVLIGYFLPWADLLIYGDIKGYQVPNMAKEAGLGTASLFIHLLPFFAILLLINVAYDIQYSKLLSSTFLILIFFGFVYNIYTSEISDIAYGAGFYFTLIGVTISIYLWVNEVKEFNEAINSIFFVIQTILVFSLFAMILLAIYAFLFGFM